MSLIERIKKYFTEKNQDQNTANAPEGVCPNCWGKQEWEGEFYKKIKAHSITPEQNTYNNFIHKVAEKLDKITLSKDTYTCETCNISQKKSSNL